MQTQHLTFSTKAVRRRRKGWLTVTLVLIFGLLSQLVGAQDDCSTPGVQAVTVSEIGADGRIELFNGTAQAIDLAEFYLYTSPAYRQLEDLALECGDLILPPGEVLTVSALPGFDATGGEVGLYADSDFTNPASLLAYVAYGEGSRKRAPVALAAGLYNTGDAAPTPTAGLSVQATYSSAGGLAYESMTPDFCTVDFSLVAVSTPVAGGSISLDGGATQTSICVDGNGDPLEVIRDGTAVGSERAFVITDDAGNILALPDGAGPFDLDGAGVGTCEIWYLAYEPGLTGKAVGGNLADLAGCFDLSNPITVVREAPDGGTLTLAGGGTDFIGCAGDIVFDVTHTTTAPNLSYWYVITDEANTILGFANSANTSTLDLSGAPAGTCRVWGWSYRGLPDPVVGEPLSSVAPAGSCADLSDDFITVYREVPDGGTITTAGGAADTTVTAGDAFVSVAHATTAQFLSYWYIITDEAGTILGFANSADTGTLDLSGAPAGVCRIWGWSYRGLGDPVVGDNIATLTDDFCETISEGFVTVNRVADDGEGFQFTDAVISEVSADGEIEIFNGTDAAIDVTDYYLCNFPAYTRVGNLTLDCGTLVIQPGDYAVVSGWSGFDAQDGELGLYRTPNYGSSDAIVSYLEFGTPGHFRAGVAIAAGIWEADLVAPSPTADETAQAFTETGTLEWSLAEATLCAANVGTTATGLLDNGGTLRLYPNPVSDELTVDLQNVGDFPTDLQLFSPSGQLIRQLHRDVANGRTTIDMSALPAGTYLLRIVNEAGFATRLIGKQ